MNQSSNPPGDARMDIRPMLLVSAAAIAVMALIGAYAWLQLPADAQVPIHWGPSGEPDGWADKTVGLFLLPVIAAGTAILLAIVPRIEPRRANLAASAKAYGAVWIGVMALFTVMQALSASFALGADFDFTRVVMIGTGVLFVVIGNYLPKVKSNFMMGVRTPWTLTSDVSWRKTHRLGGRLFVIAGLVFVALGILGASGEALVIALLATIAVVLVATVAYSYQVWKTDPERRALG